MCEMSNFLKIYDDGEYIGGVEIFMIFRLELIKSLDVRCDSVRCDLFRKFMKTILSETMFSMIEGIQLWGRDFKHFSFGKSFDFTM